MPTKPATKQHAADATRYMITRMHAGVRLVVALDAFGAEEHRQHKDQVIEDGGSDEDVVIVGAYVGFIDADEVEYVEQDSEQRKAGGQSVLGEPHPVPLDELFFVHAHAMASFPAARSRCSAFIRRIFQIRFRTSSTVTISNTA